MHSYKKFKPQIWAFIKKSFFGTFRDPWPSNKARTLQLRGSQARANKALLNSTARQCAATALQSGHRLHNAIFKHKLAEHRWSTGSNFRNCMRSKIVGMQGSSNQSNNLKLQQGSLEIKVELKTYMSLCSSSSFVPQKVSTTRLNKQSLPNQLKPAQPAQCVSKVSYTFQ